MKHILSILKAFSIVDMIVTLIIIITLLVSLSFIPSRSTRATQRLSMDKVTPLGEIALEVNTDALYRYLPRTATNIIEHGKNWFEFNLNGNHWMYHVNGYRESLVLIPKTMQNRKDQNEVPTVIQNP